MAVAMPANAHYSQPPNTVITPSYSLCKTPSFTFSICPNLWRLKPYHAFNPLTLNSTKARSFAYSTSGFSLDSQSTTQEKDLFSSFDSTHDSNTDQISIPTNSICSEDIPAPTESLQQNSPRKTFTSKNSIWVNPKKPKTAALVQKYGNPKYAKLMDIAQRLNACDHTQEAVSGILKLLGDKPIAKQAVFIINNLNSWEKAHLTFKYFKAKEGFVMDKIMYNVTMKVLRKGMQWELVEELLEQMVGEGMQPDNITFSTVISCARQCKVPHKGVEWFEKMQESGCVPDEVTYSAMIDTYGRAGKVDEALKLYDKARSEGWHLDTITFATLIRMYAVSGNYEGVLNTYEEMKFLGVKVNLVIYNTMLDAMGRAGRPWQVKSLYKEMVEAGISPNRITFSALIRAYGKARWPDDALEYFAKMKEEGWELDNVLYNILLSMCADMGLVDEALGLFDEMSKSENCKPDNWSYTPMIHIYARVGQVIEAEKMLTKMLEAGYSPNVFVFTSLIQGYGKSKRYDDVVRTFDRLLEAELSPDDRLCGCLLSVLTRCEREERGKVLGCIEKANPKLSSIATLLGEDDIDVEVVIEDFRAVLSESPEEVRKPYCNCLIDLCWNLNFLDRAHQLLDLGISFEVYSDLQSKSPTEWSLNLKTLSLGAALAAFQNWMSSLLKAVEDGEELPPVIGIHTGHGTHKFSDKGLVTALESRLRDMRAPFHESPDRVGWLLTTGIALTLWFQSRNSPGLSTA
eukprot:Gb_17291 [translate_table: standard]